MNPMEVLAILVIPAVLGSVFVAALHHSQRRKELEHEERMAAMNMGVLPSSRGLSWPAAAVCVGIGAGVPIGTFLVTLIATLSADPPGGIWVAPVFVSFAAIRAAEKLAFRTLKGHPGVPDQAARAVAKPTYDPEAFEFAGRRG